MLAASAAMIATADPLFTEPYPRNQEDGPVARLSIPDGQTPLTRTTHQAMHRETVLDALAERLLDAGAREPGQGIVHAQGGYPDGTAAVHLADQLNWPLVITEHSSSLDRVLADPARRSRYAAAIARSHRLVAVSEMLAGELRAAFPAHAERIVVLPNAVPMDLFTADGLERRVADQLLFVGHRKATKGIDTLLRAVAVARRGRPSISLRLLGSSPDEATEARWRGLAESLGLGDCVTFEQAKGRADIAAAMARTSLFAHASPRETFGVVAVEALASGTPVVATDSGGVTEIMGADPETLGALVPVDDPEALGAAILSTLDRRATFDPIALRAAVERRFGSAFVAERLLVLYREALAARPGPGTAIQIGAGPPSLTQGQTVVVALDRARAALALQPLPPEIRAELSLVTAVQPASVVLPSVGSVVEVELDTDWRATRSASAWTRRNDLAGRIARAARDPFGALRRRLGRDAGSPASLVAATVALRRLVAAVDGRTVIVPLDGHDHVVATPLIGDRRVVLARGGLQDLADAWQAAGRGSQAAPA